MKMKEFGPAGGGACVLGAPLDPPMVSPSKSWYPPPPPPTHTISSYVGHGTHGWRNKTYVFMIPKIDLINKFHIAEIQFRILTMYVCLSETLF